LYRPKSEHQNRTQFVMATKNQKKKLYEVINQGYNFFFHEKRH